MILDYCVLAKSNYEEFKTVMKSYIENGWQPHGSFSVDALGNLYQAMVKYAKTSCNNCGVGAIDIVRNI